MTDDTLTRGTSVTVALGERSYDILIGAGLLSRLGAEIAERFGRDRRVAIITDENVEELHGEAVTASLAAAGINAVTITVPAGEPSKSFSMLETVVSEILETRLERGDFVLALGGGVVGDLAGFAAAIARRGMRFIQVPTSLLAQVDSSVGGKTGINTEAGKNLVGAFYQPALVVACSDVLDTLPDREFAAGYAEVVKYGLINRPGFFEWLEKNRGAVFQGGPERQEAIAECCEAKADIVRQDEREGGVRALLNLGHTFGHALEKAVGYDPKRLIHGEGVSIGICLAHRFSVMLGLLDETVALRVEDHFRSAGLPVKIRDIPGDPMDAGMLLSHMKQDKKVERGALTFILTRGLGQSFIEKNVPEDKVLHFLNEELKR